MCDGDLRTSSCDCLRDCESLIVVIVLVMLGGDVCCSITQPHLYLVVQLIYSKQFHRSPSPSFLIIIILTISSICTS